jgi:hypothetical protein
MYGISAMLNRSSSHSSASQLSPQNSLLLGVAYRDPDHG